jgi:hypothetical protein
VIPCVDWLEPDLLEGDQNFSESKRFSPHPMAPAREVSYQVPAAARDLRVSREKQSLTLTGRGRQAGMNRHQARDVSSPL